jgi:hypothetical protein
MAKQEATERALKDLQHRLAGYPDGVSLKELLSGMGGVVAERTLQR